MRKLVLLGCSIGLFCSLAASSHAQTSARMKSYTFEGITFSHPAPGPSFTFQVTVLRSIHRDGDFALFDSSGKKRLDLTVPAGGRSTDLSRLQYFNQAGRVITAYNITRDLVDQLNRTISIVSERCPLNITIDRSTAKISKIQTTCDELAISQTEDFKG